MGDKMYIYNIFSISFISLFLFIILLILNGFNTFFMFLIFISMMSFLFGFITFYKLTNKYPLNDISKYHIDKFKKLLIKS